MTGKSHESKLCDKERQKQEDEMGTESKTQGEHRRRNPQTTVIYHIMKVKDGKRLDYFQNFMVG